MVAMVLQILSAAIVLYSFLTKVVNVEPLLLLAIWLLLFAPVAQAWLHV